MAASWAQVKTIWISVWHDLWRMFAWKFVLVALHCFPKGDPEVAILGAAAKIAVDRWKREKAGLPPLCRTCLDPTCEGDSFHELKGTWAPTDRRRAFVDGAKWWEFKVTNGTMWPDDIREAEAEATRRFASKETP